MTARKQALALLALLVLACATRVAFAYFVRSHGLADAAYYYDTAASLASGRGLESKVVWNYLRWPEPQTLVHAGHAYWGPLLSLLLGLFFAIGGIGWKTAVACMTLVAVALLCLTALLGRLLFQSDAVGVLAVIFLTVNVPVTFLSVTTDTPLLFAALVNGALLCLVAARDGRERMWAAAGILAGLAALTRQDGLLVLLVVLGFAVQHGRETRLGKARFTFPLLVGLACLLPLLPWYARNWAAFGSPVPVSVSRLLALESYDDLFTVERIASGGGLFARGLLNAVVVKAKACFANLATLFDPQTLVLFVFGLFALPTILRDRRTAPFWVYGIALVVVLGAVFPFHSSKGTFFRSMIALYPFVTCAAVFGFHKVCDWARFRLRKRQRWRSVVITAREAGMHALLLVFTGIWAFALVLPTPVSQFGELNRAFEVLARELDALDRADALAKPAKAGAAPRSSLMSNFSLDVAVRCDRPTAQLPRDPDRDMAVQVARKYGIRYLVILHMPRFLTKSWETADYATRTGRIRFVKAVEAKSQSMNLTKILIYRFEHERS